jgi:hypothetical protein
MTPDDYEEKIANKIERIHQLELEALRRAGVAKEKEQGLEIESTEAVRLFREATGYLIRLRELREDIEGELQYAEYYHAGRVVGALDDYNRILRDVRRNESFKNSVESFDPITYRESHQKYKITIENNTETIPTTYADAYTSEQKSVPMDGTTNVETFVYPRISRLTKEMETSIIGRCASGKRPG